MRVLLATRSTHKAAEAAQILAAAVEGLRLVTLESESIAHSPAEESLEPFDTFEENAASKARYFARLSGLATVADDSGLAVDALGGRPGVRTKRFAPRERYPGLPRDEANNRHLVECLRGLPPAERGARYVCVACFFDPATGRMAARHRPLPRRGPGADSRMAARHRINGFFGYDPGKTGFLLVTRRRKSCGMTNKRRSGVRGVGCEFGPRPSQTLQGARGAEAAPPPHRTYAELSADLREKNQRSHRGRAFRALARFLGSDRLVMSTASSRGFGRLAVTSSASGS